MEMELMHRGRPSAKSSPVRSAMSKRRIYTRPITKISLYWISTVEIYAGFALLGVAELLAVCASIFLMKIPASGIGSVVLGGLAITAMLLMLGYGLVQTRTRPPYRYYRKRGIDFPNCLKGKRLTCTDGEHYLYCDDRWFVAALTMGASALCADVVDFSVPAIVKVQSARGGIAHKYYFRTNDGKRICVRLGRQYKPLKKWVQAHGGSIE